MVDICSGARGGKQPHAWVRVYIRPILTVIFRKYLPIETIISNIGAVVTVKSDTNDSHHTPHHQPLADRRTDRIERITNREATAYQW